ncbi:MAG: DUF1592 domain-containing protein [Aeoliella sp.]
MPTSLASYLLSPTRPTAPLSIGLALLLVVVSGVLASARPAATIYEQACASCHGANGEGVSGKYEEALAGELSVKKLAERIAETMPEDDPEACVGDEALAVARFIHAKFYSPEAQRTQGLVAEPRLDLARLTEPQHRNAIADLIAAFTPSVGKAADDGGLRGEYYQSDGMNKLDQRRLERIDSRIDFDFATGKPADAINADQFAIIWRGSFVAQHTGQYEFRIRTQNGARLFVNEDGEQHQGKLRDDSSQTIQTRLIDAWVSSGELQDHTARVFLLGGRRYSMRLEYFKYKEPTASIRLEWKPPFGVWAVPDEQVFFTAPMARTFVVDTPFPADDRSLGYERGSSVSREWHDATTSAALAAAEEVIDRLPLLSGAPDSSSESQPALADFAARFASVAFRRPLTPNEEILFRETLFAESPPEEAVRRAVLLSLTSPHFLYTDLSPPDAAPTQHTQAARLALAMWDSLPDAQLRQAANQGELATPDALNEHATRMLSDPRARSKMRGFFRHWLELEERDLAKDAQLFPEFDETVIADLRRSLELFVEKIVWSESSDYRQLLTADHLLLNSRLGKLYAPSSANESTAESNDTEFVSIAYAPEQRSGVLTHPYLLSAFAYHNNTSPIHRGVFLTRNIVGRSLKPPPVAVAFEDGKFAPELTMREKVTQLTRDQACMSCHEVINPLGFALENYDAIGRWRTSDNDKPLDTRGEITTADGTSHAIAGARDIANFTITSESAHRAFVTQLFRHLVQRDPSAYGRNVADQLRQEFATDNFHIQRLMVRIATLTATHDNTIAMKLEDSP